MKATIKILSLIFTKAVSVVLLSFLIIPSCKTKDKEGDLKSYNISMDLSRSLSFTDFIERVEVMTFEVTDNSLIKDISEIRCYENYIFLSDCDQQQIFIFSKDGKFINKINSRGSGPQEYLNLGSFEVDNFGNRLCVLDPMKGNLISYSLNGEFIKIEKLPSLSEGAYRDFSFIENDCILFTAHNPFARIRIYNTEKGITEREFMPHNSEYSSRSSCRIFNKTYISEEYSDLVYQYAEGEFRPSYHVNLDNLSCSLVDNIDNYEFPENIRKLINSELSDYHINSMNGNSGIIYINLFRKGGGYSFLIDRDCNEFFCFNAIGKEFFPNIKYMDNEIMIGLYYEEGKEQYLKALSEYGFSLPSDEELEGMNPILIKYHLKNR